MKIYRESILTNGLSVITVEDKSRETVSAVMWISAGSRYEKQDERGLAHLVEHMLIKETKIHPLEQLGEYVDRIGAYLNANTSVESISIRTQTTKPHYVEMLEILAEIVTQPIIKPKTLENEKKIILEEIVRFNDGRGARIGVESMKLIFENHPLSQNPLGNKECIMNATTTQLQKYYDTYITPNRSVLIISGDIIHEDIISLAQKYFVSSWKQGGKDIDKSKIFPTQKLGSRFVLEASNQTQLFFNFVCPNIQLRELAMLELIANTLGYGRVPILKQELRHKEGLIYAAGANISKFRDAALFYISTATTRPKEVIENVKHILAKLDDLYNNEEKFREFKEQFKNVLTRKITSQKEEIELLWILKKLTGRLIEPQEMIQIIDSLTYNDITALIKKFLSPNNLFITAFGEKDPFTE